MSASPPEPPASFSPATPHIEVNGLELYYGSVPAVRGISFNVMPGEQLTLLGPVRLRQDHDAARGRRPGTADGRRDSHRRCAGVLVCS